MKKTAGKVMRKSASLWRKRLVARAKKLAASGYSSIPVLGSSAPTEPKRPAVSWRVYQSRIASAGEIERIFSREAKALGIVCGRVSKLLVIDFDDDLRYRRFCRHLPQYCDTYTVKTKRGFHLYFATSVKVASHQFEGGDIKGERSYVVAPPSEIAGFVYRCVKDVPELEVGQEDVNQLLNYFHVKAESHAVAGRRLKDTSDIDLRRVYQRLALRIGRNNALYRVASMARERGMEKREAESTLLRFHAKAPGRPGHKGESRLERLSEGMRTIESAYGGVARGLEGRGGVPNSVRERLLRSQRSTVMARLLDCFVLAGWQAESYFSLKEAVCVGRQYGLNRKSVLQALTGEHSSYNGRHIISRRYVEYVDIGGLKERKRGRPVELAFQAPAPGRLLSVLDVERSPSDRMRSEDLRSAKSYRMAVHREYIRRLSPRSSLAVLARRVGVDERTIRRYNQALQVKLTACVGELELTWDALASLPRRGWRAGKNTTNGVWLEAGDGSRRPAWRHIGAKLLKAGDRGARVCVRRASVYRLQDESQRAVEYETLSLRQFARLAVLRGGSSAGGGAMQRLGEAVAAARERASTARYEKIQLFFDSVEARIADDKVAETISGYLCARDEAGGEVRRPVKRGIAYRLLKEYGEGKVFLALRSSYKEVMASLARHALRSGDAERSLDMVAGASAGA